MNKVLEVYFSVDVEADGPYPGEYSMSSIGVAVAGYKTSEGDLVVIDSSLEENQFYAELKPISEKCVPEAAAVSGLDRALLAAEGQTPENAMTHLSQWLYAVMERLDARGAVFAAYPLGFDWMWTYWYLSKYSRIASPFGHSRHIDIKTLYSARSGEMIIRSIKRNMPRRLRSTLPHTHNALDDAREQGELLMNLLAWDGKF